MTMTVGEYQTPSGRFINEKGIEPHAVIKKRPPPEHDNSKPYKKSLLDSFEIARAFEQLQKMAKK